MFQMRTHKTSSLAVAITTLVVLLAMAAPAFATDAGQVQASVQMEQYCVNLELGSDLSFGAAGLGQAVEEIDDHAIIIRNSGTGAATIMVQGTDASGPDGATWTLADTVDRGAFAWYFIDLSEDSTHPAVFVSKEPRVLLDRLEYQETIALNTVLLTPTCSVAPGVFTWDATIYAVPVVE